MHRPGSPLSRRLVPAPAALLAILGVALASAGCGAVVSNVSAGVAEDLSVAILNQDDPELVREALPAYLLLIDSFIEADPENSITLSSGSQLYAAYGAAFVDDADRSRTLTSRARDYGNRALCAADAATCELAALDFDGYTAVISSIGQADVEPLFSYSLANLAWIRSNSADYAALAELPKIEVALEHLMTLDPGENAASASMYLGILKTLRPAALGGDPEAGKQWFERGIELSDGRDLSIKVEYARGYARQVYDRELHDRLLNEVLETNVQVTGLVLFNKLAREQAKQLLASADDYF
jgi:hypothetical protein